MNNIWVVLVVAYILVALGTAIWGARFIKFKKTADWENDRVGSLLFSLYFGITWPAIFFDGFDK